MATNRAKFDLGLWGKRRDRDAVPAITEPTLRGWKYVRGTDRCMVCEWIATGRFELSSRHSRFSLDQQAVLFGDGFCGPGGGHIWGRGMGFRGTPLLEGDLCRQAGSRPCSMHTGGA